MISEQSSQFLSKSTTIPQIFCHDLLAGQHAMNTGSAGKAICHVTNDANQHIHVVHIQLLVQKLTKHNFTTELK